RSDSTIADLHASLQRVLGWSDDHLNRFIIHGREYGVWHDGEIGFRDDPRHVRLANLGLRVRERFLYEYDFTDGWQHDVRVWQIGPTCRHATLGAAGHGARGIRFRVQLVSEADGHADAEHRSVVHEVAQIDHAALSVHTLGLQLEEAKNLLQKVHALLIDDQ